MALAARPKRTTIPNFLLTNTVDVTVISISGDWVKGRWEEGEPVPRVIKANVQPLRFNETMNMPEADRTREWIKVYTTDTILTLEESKGKPADIVEWQGHKYRAMRSRSYHMGVLNHNHVLCAREPESAL